MSYILERTMKMWTVALMMTGMTTLAQANEFSGINDMDVPTAEPGTDPGDLPIINGADAAVADYPMTGGLIAEGKIGGFGGMTFLCSSSLIAPDVVLTAAHCVDIEGMIGVKLDELKFHYIRDADLTAYQLGATAEVPADAGTGSDYVIYPDYVGAQGVQVGLSANHDIALIFLDEAVDHPYAYLPTKDEVSQIVADMNVTIVGWGQQTSSQQPEPGTVQIKQVADSFISEMGETEFKVGEEKEDGRKCHGDSGGPTFATVETEALEDMRIIGVTSHAYDMTDCRETGGVDTKISAYWDWIDEEMRARCADGTRAWCNEEGIISPPMPAEPGDTGDEETPAGGCACDATGGWASSMWAGVLVMALVRRRRS